MFPALMVGLKMSMRETFARVDHSTLAHMWQEVEYRFGIARVTGGAHIQLFTNCG
jgi:hypothetical protein